MLGTPHVGSKFRAKMVDKSGFWSDMPKELEALEDHLKEDESSVSGSNNVEQRRIAVVEKDGITHNLAGTTRHADALVPGQGGFHAPVQGITLISSPQGDAGHWLESSNGTAGSAGAADPPKLSRSCSISADLPRIQIIFC